MIGDFDDRGLGGSGVTNRGALATHPDDPADGHDRANSADGA